MEKNMNLITVTELAMLVGCSVQTIGTYYKFKKENPSDEYAKMLPDYIRVGKRQTRYWKKEDAEAIIEFRKKIPQGRNGALGSVTQRYCKPHKKEVAEENTSEKRITLQQYLDAEEKSIMSMAKFMKSQNHEPEDDEAMGMMLGLIIQVTSQMQDILFGEQDDIEKVFDFTTEGLANYEPDEVTLYVVDDDEK